MWVVPRINDSSLSSVSWTGIFGREENNMYELSKSLNSFFKNGESKKKKYIIDTNYLLNIFSLENGKEFFEALKSSSEQLYIPFIVWLELCYNVDNKVSDTNSDLQSYKNYLNKIEKEKSELKINDIKTKISNIFQRAIIKDINGSNDLHAEAIEKIFTKVKNKISEEDTFKKLNATIKESIEEWQQEIKSGTLNQIEKHIEETKERFIDLEKLISEKSIQVGEPYNKTQLEEFIRECETREKKQFPPGNSEEDLSKKSIKRWGDLHIPAKYGDMLVWLETIDFAKKNEDKDIEYIIVSDDVEKDDWLHPKTNSLYPEMKIEFFSKTGAKVSHLVSDLFVKEITGKVITEDEDFSKENEIMKNQSTSKAESKIQDSIFDELVSDEGQTNSFEDFFVDYSSDDTVIVPARSTGFKEVFIGENRWYSIRMKDERIKYIKYTRGAS